jgi:acylphosphatase
LTVRRCVLVSGRVQGVFFRAACHDEASRAGVGGWVRNLADGRVEAVFEGDETAVQALIDWCQHGPRTARVRDVEVHEEDPVGVTAFEVR